MRHFYFPYIVAFSVVALFMACSKNEIDLPESDLNFTEKCDFTGWDNTQEVHQMRGTLEYTDQVMGHEYPSVVFLITPDEPTLGLAYIVCNMPGDFEMTPGESLSVVFSGRTWVIPDDERETAYSPYRDLELSHIQFN